MRKLLGIVLALCLALSLFACAKKTAAPAAPGTGGTETGGAANTAAGQDAAPKQAAEEIEVWHYTFQTETAKEEYKADDGTLLATWSFEEPILRMENEKGETFLGQMPVRGVREEQLAVCRAFNDAVAVCERESLAEFEDVKAEADAQYEWKNSQNIEFMPLASDLTVERTYQHGDLLSILAMDYINLSGAHPDWGYVSWNFDLAAGEFVTPASLTDEPDALRKTISDEVVYGVYDSEWYEGYYDDFETIIRAKEDFDVCFCEDGMTVYFSEYEIAPRALGLPEFTIPYAEIGRFLNERGQRLLDLPAEDRALGDYYEAEEMWYWFEGAMPIDDSTHTDDYYYRVDIPGVTTLAGLREKLRTRFTDELVEQRISAAQDSPYPLLSEIDGVLYAIPAGRGTNMYIDTVDYQAELNAGGTSGRILATIHWRDYDEEKEEWYPTDTSEVEFPFEMTDSGAKFATFRTIW